MKTLTEKEMMLVAGGVDKPTKNPEGFTWLGKNGDATGPTWTDKHGNSFTTGGIVTPPANDPLGGGPKTSSGPSGGQQFGGGIGLTIPTGSHDTSAGGGSGDNNPPHHRQ